MSRYIDADIAKNLILDDMAKAEREGKDTNGYTDALFHLKTMPTADVAPVRHAYWDDWENVTTSKSGRKIHSFLLNCSECHAPNGRTKDKYCRHCGAKMDAIPF